MEKLSEILIWTNAVTIFMAVVIIISAAQAYDSTKTSREFWMDSSERCHIEKLDMVDQFEYDELVTITQLSINNTAYWKGRAIYWHNDSNYWYNITNICANNYDELSIKYQECNDLGYKVYDRGIEWRDLATECTAKVVRLANTGYVYVGYSNTYWCSPIELW